jgi:hypothetical protein
MNSQDMQFVISAHFSSLSPNIGTSKGIIHSTNTLYLEPTPSRLIDLTLCDTHTLQATRMKHILATLRSCKSIEAFMIFLFESDNDQRLSSVTQNANQLEQYLQILLVNQQQSQWVIIHGGKLSTYTSHTNLSEATADGHSIT